MPVWFGKRNARPRSWHLIVNEYWLLLIFFQSHMNTLDTSQHKPQLGVRKGIRVASNTSMHWEIDTGRIAGVALVCVGFSFSSSFLHKSGGIFVSSITEQSSRD